MMNYPDKLIVSSNPFMILLLLSIFNCAGKYNLTNALEYKIFL